MTGAFPGNTLTRDGYNCGYSDDPDLDVSCKAEYSPSPSPLPERKGYSRSKTGAKTVKSVSLRNARGRVVKRARKPNATCTQHRTLSGVEVIVECEMTEDEDGILKPRTRGCSEKKSICNFVTTKGYCGQRFQRKEHLKRHQRTHSATKEFKCPLPGCTAAIARSDNACDHFRTHLERKKGSRNPQCEWEELEGRIRNGYPLESAKKIITNLERWLTQQRAGKRAA